MDAGCSSMTRYYTVVGVMPKEFAFPVSQRIWIPLRTNPSDYPRDQPLTVFVFARLAPGFTLESAQAEVMTLGLAQNRVARPNEQRESRGSPARRVVPYVTGLFTIDASRRWTGSVVLLLAALLLAPPLRKHRDIGLRAGRHATRGVRGAVRAGCNPRPHRLTDFRRGTRARRGSRNCWIPPCAPVRRADLETRLAGHRTGECPLLVRFQSLSENGDLPGWTGCRRPPRSLVACPVCE